MTAPQAEAVIDLDAYRANLRLLGACPTAALLAVVKANGYGHGMAAVRARRAGGRRRLARRRHASTRRWPCGALGRHRAGAVLARRPGRRLRGRDRRRTSRSPRRRPTSCDEIASASAGHPSAARCSSRSTPACPATAHAATSGSSWSRRRRPNRRLAASCTPAPGRTSPAPTSRNIRRNDAQEAAFMEALDAAARGRAWSRACATWPTRRPRSRAPSSHLDLVRVGIASYGLPPSATMARRPAAAPGHDPARPARRRQARARRAAVCHTAGRTPLTGKQRSDSFRSVTARASRAHASGRLSAATAVDASRIVGAVAMDQVGRRPGRRRRGAAVTSSPCSVPATTASHG